MPLFRYTATDATARTVSGCLEAVDDRMAAAELRRGGYYPIRIEPQAAESAFTFADDLLQMRRRPSRKDVLSFTQHFHNLLAAGLEVDRSLAILSELAERPQMGAIIRSLLQDIQAGNSLADSLAKHPKVFPKVYVQMVKAGETGGVLELVLDRLGMFMERAQVIRDEVSSALLYPVLVLLAGIGAVVVLLNVVVPRFATMFAESGELLPPPTQLLLAVSTFTTNYWWVLAGLAGATVLGGHAFLQTDAGRGHWDRLVLRLPVLGTLILELEVGRFARLLGTLLQSGVPILVALGIVSETVTNAALARALPMVHDGVKRGEGIAGPLKACGMFPALAIHMAMVGEEAGRLEDMLLKVADVYDLHVKTSIKRLLSLVEPALILCLSVVVGFIVVAMLLAVLSMSDLAQ